MNNIIKYTAVSATTDVEDRYDGDVFDNFSGLETDGDTMDLEFSDARGDFAKKIGGALKKGGLKKILQNRSDGLDDRLSDRKERITSRTNRKTKRSNAREERKNLRQVAKFKQLTPDVENTVDKIVSQNPKTKEPIDKTKEGLGNEKDEKIADTVIDAAKDLVNTGSTDIPIIELDPTGNVTEVKDTWWKKKSTGVKVAIIGGGIVALGLTIWGIAKLRKK